MCAKKSKDIFIGENSERIQNVNESGPNGLMVKSVVKGIAAMETLPYFEGSTSTVPDGHDLGA